MRAMPMEVTCIVGASQRLDAGNPSAKVRMVLIDSRVGNRDHLAIAGQCHATIDSPCINRLCRCQLTCNVITKLPRLKLGDKFDNGHPPESPCQILSQQNSNFTLGGLHDRSTSLLDPCNNLCGIFPISKLHVIDNRWTVRRKIRIAAGPRTAEAVRSTQEIGEASPVDYSVRSSERCAILVRSNLRRSSRCQCDEDWCDQCCPAGLVAGSQAAAGVGVEVFVEEHQVVPMWIADEPFASRVAGTVSV